MITQDEVEQLRASLKEADHIQSELDRRIFYLKTLYDVSKDIFSSIETDSILRNFLLMSMGNFGVMEAFVLLMDMPAKEIIRFVPIGFDDTKFAALQKSGMKFLLNEAYQGLSANGPALRRLRMFPSSVEYVLPFSVETDYLGLLGMGPKIVGDPYNENDKELLDTLLNNLVVALKNAKLYEDLKVLDKAKERVINHLSHELKTPLAIIIGVLSRIRKRLDDAILAGLDKTLDRGERNVKRLIDLQSKIDDILNQRSVEEKERILDIIESAAGLVGEIKEEYNDPYAKILGIISDRLESLLSKTEIRKEEIQVGEFLHTLYDYTLSDMGERELNIARNFDNGIRLFTDRSILEKVCQGLLKNAIENTPDEGTIEIIAKKENGEIWITFRDYGVGISQQNQKLIFGGFFHTQDTDFYSSKKPYEFNAGGTGSDLLRIKTFSERLDFSVEFYSTRCKFIPTDREICPGRISACQSITEKSECLDSGGSVFLIKFPVNQV